MIRGQVFREMILVPSKKAELQAKTQSYRPKVGVTTGETSRIRTELAHGIVQPKIVPKAEGNC